MSLLKKASPALWILWLTTVISLYFLVHKPIIPPTLNSLLSSISNLATALVLFLLAAVVGQVVLGHIGEALPLERAVLYPGAGLGILSLIVLMLGVLSFLFKWPLWLMILVAIVLLRRKVIVWLKDVHKIIDGKLSLFEKICLAFVVLTIGINLCFALAPPTKWDALVYHLEVPKRYLINGKVAHLPENLYSGFPQVASMVYLLAMTLVGDQAAVICGWMVGLLTLIGLEALTQRLFGPKHRWLSSAILLCGTSISGAFSWAYADIWVLFFGLVCLICLLRFAQEGRFSWVAYAGVFAGFALGTKYTAGTILLTFSIGLVYLVNALEKREALAENPYKKRDLALIFRTLLVFWSSAIFVFSPWLVKNWVYSGNPLHPIDLPPHSLNPWEQRFIVGERASRSLTDDILLPWEVVIFGVEGGVVAGKPEYSAEIGALWLALIPGLFTGMRKFELHLKKAMEFFAFISLSTWGMWVVFAHLASELVYSRHYYGMFPTLIMLAVGGYHAVCAQKIFRVRVSRVTQSMIVLTLILTSISETTRFVRQNPLGVILGVRTKEQYLMDTMDGYGALISTMDTLPSEKVFMLWEPRVYYCKMLCFPDATLHNWWYLRTVYHDVHLIAQELRSRDYEYVIIYHQGLEWAKRHQRTLTDEDYAELDRFIHQELDLVVDIDSVYRVYRLSKSGSFHIEALQLEVKSD